MNTNQPPVIYEDMVSALEKYEAATTYEAEDLTKSEYIRDSEFGSLNWNGSKFELNEWSARQVCRMAGIPFGVFRKASGELTADMFKEFVPTIKDPQVKLGVKHFGQNKRKVLRGVLPVDYPDVRNSEILRGLEVLTEPFEVDYAGWMDEAHPSVLRTRIIFPTIQALVEGEELKIGLDITSSELGGCPLQLNPLLFRTVCKNGMIASYGKKPYFFFDYKTAFAMNLDDIFGAALGRCTTDLNGFMEKAASALQSSCSNAVARGILGDLVKDGALNKGVAVKSAALFEKDGGKSVWDMINALTSQARGFRDLLRIKYERAAGHLLGLEFSRNRSEDEYADRAPVFDIDAQSIPQLTA